jgi:hypothetical protein
MSKSSSLPSGLSPRLLNREASAAYVSASPTLFDQLVDLGLMPKPKILSRGRKAWCIRELDAACDALPTAERPADDTYADIDAEIEVH